MATKTNRPQSDREELQARLAVLEEEQAELTAVKRTTAKELQDLEATASATLADADLGDVRKTAHAQAQAKVDAEACRATIAEIDRRLSALAEQEQALRQRLAQWVNLDRLEARAGAAEQALTSLSALQAAMARFDECTRAARAGRLIFPPELSAVSLADTAKKASRALALERATITTMRGRLEGGV